MRRAPPSTAGVRPAKVAAASVASTIASERRTRLGCTNFAACVRGVDLPGITKTSVRTRELRRPPTHWRPLDPGYMPRYGRWRWGRHYPRRGMTFLAGTQAMRYRGAIDLSDIRAYAGWEVPGINGGDALRPRDRVI